MDTANHREVLQWRFKHRGLQSIDECLLAFKDFKWLNAGFDNDETGQEVVP